MPNAPLPITTSVIAIPKNLKLHEFLMAKTKQVAKNKLKVRNMYRGWCPINGNKSWLERIDAECISPKQFYNRYVKRRMPVILKSSNTDCLRAFSIDAMQAISGNCRVVVEKADPESYHQYGRTDSSSRTCMKFGDFLSRMNDEDLYCTTQPLEEDKRGPKKITSPHIQKFIERGMIPQTLPIMGNLQLYQINSWIGSSEDGSSSGFHHDFHDNFYLLISGEKQFRLASPNLAVEQPTFGCQKNPQVIVHPNGLISYMGSCIREDGARVVDVLKWKLSQCPESEELQEALQDAIADEMIARVGFMDAGSNPPSFSVQPTAHGEYITETLRAGEMLYMPASFFHEVISFSGQEAGSEDKHHMAINYWYYPPATGGTFEKPYEDEFWKHRWETLAKKEQRRKRIDFDRMRRRKVPLSWIYKKGEIREFLDRVQTAKKLKTI